jgi:glycosyltransferase involved in cell wall biosynthesis
MVGRLSAEKGAAVMADACSISQAHCVFVGDGPERAALKRSGLAPVVTGWVAAEQVSVWLRKSRALVFPSLCYETQGLVVLEAAAQGVPALVSDRCAAQDLVKDGVTGLVFRHGSATDLASKMKLLMDDPDLAARLGRSAYEQFWHAPPTLAAHALQLEALYLRVLANRG